MVTLLVTPIKLFNDRLGLHIRPSNSGQLSLAIPLWVGKMTTGSGYNHR